MTAIMTAPPEPGHKRKRTCSGICHKARLPDCRCICVGRFHGSKMDGTYEHKVEVFSRELEAELRKELIQKGVQLQMANG